LWDHLHFFTSIALAVALTEKMITTNNVGMSEGVDLWENGHLAVAMPVPPLWKVVLPAKVFSRLKHSSEPS